MRISLAALLVLPLLARPTHASDDLAKLEQQAFSEAVSNVAQSVVRIRTIGGLDRVGKTLISAGPTTGLIVSADGYIVSSAFNFAGKPSSILVRLADGQQLAAELVGRDTNRMLVLLKVNAERALPVPTATPLKAMQVGQWAIAVGRTFQTDRVDLSVGIVSALRRMYGRVLQTDANVSVANYGGPLVDISGNVLGILVPMSPQPASGESAELAGAAFYDSGIGFAVPLEHVLEVLERWKEQPELLPGKLGIGLLRGDPHTTAPKITSVQRESPAAEAGWQANDLISNVNGTKVATQAQLRFAIAPLYADDTVRITVERGEDTIKADVTLTGALAPYRHAFLGVLPKQSRKEDEAKGALVQWVWPDSPADLAGLRAGDRITKFDDSTISAASNMQKQLLAAHPRQTVSVTASRADQTMPFEVTLSEIPDTSMTATDLESFRKQRAAAGAGPADLVTLKVPEFEQEALYYAPKLAAAQQPGLLLWLGNGDRQTTQSLVDQWRSACDRDRLILMVAPPKPNASWATDDAAYLRQLVRLAVRQFRVDRRRLVAIGAGKAGQLAYALALGGRSRFGGVVGIDAPLPRTLKLRDASPSHRMAVMIVQSPESGFTPLVRRDLAALREAGYPTTKLMRPVGTAGESEIDNATRSSMSRWLVGLEFL